MHAVGVSPLHTFGDVTDTLLYAAYQLISTADNTSGNRNEFLLFAAPSHQQLLKSRLEAPLISLFC
jgi:hypothetical protein